MGPGNPRIYRLCLSVCSSVVWGWGGGLRSEDSRLQATGIRSEGGGIFGGSPGLYVWRCVCVGSAGWTVMACGGAVSSSCPFDPSPSHPLQSRASDPQRHQPPATSGAWKEGGDWRLGQGGGVGGGGGREGGREARQMLAGGAAASFSELPSACSVKAVSSGGPCPGSGLGPSDGTHQR